MKKKMLRYLSIFAVLCIILAGSGSSIAFAAYKMPYYITVDLTNQIVTIYNTKDDSIARQMLCSAGMNDCTPTGTWYMAKKEKPEERREWYYFKSFNCYAKYASRIFYQYFFHSITFNRKSNKSISSAAVKAFGSPASHGCIRLRIEDAEFIAKNCFAGTKVTIYKSGEKDESLRRLLYAATYIQDEMPYNEFLGISEDSLGRGSTGEEVGRLQQRLRELGYYDATVDENYDTETIACVKQMQKDIGMVPNGIVDTQLSELIYSDDAPVSDGLVSVREGQTGPAVRKLQSALSALKLYNGEIDGIYDIDVAIAVDTIQTMCGYEVDGREASPDVQRAIYYEINRMREELGNEFTVSTLDESIQVCDIKTPDKVRINVRSKPDTDSESICQLKDGDTVFLNAAKEKWAQITTGGKTGYVMTKYLTAPYVKVNSVLEFSSPDGKKVLLGRTAEEIAAGKPTEAKRISGIISSEEFNSIPVDVEICKVNTGSESVELNIRSGPDAQSEIIGSVPNGTELRVLNHGEEWTRAACRAGIGYLKNDYLEYRTGTTEDIENALNASDEESAILYEYGTDEGSDQPVSISDVSDEHITAIVVPDKKDKKVPVYSNPDTESEESFLLKADTEVRVIGVDEETGWCLISDEGKNGYMKDVNLSFRLGNGNI